MNQTQVEQLLFQYPLVRKLIDLENATWFNPDVTTLSKGLPHVGLTEDDVLDAEARLMRFAPYLRIAFPEVKPSGGVIESPLARIPEMQRTLEMNYDQPITGSLWLKKDSHLPISGSIKARGGIYEVLNHAEQLALGAGMLTVDQDYSVLFSDRFRDFFRRNKIVVGSTGNLGLSIGIMGSRLGFDVSVHMSADASVWKKSKLREMGVNVVEHEEDYGVAVAEGRRLSELDPQSHFVDDENSRTLFLGYAVAGLRLRRQFEERGIRVDEQHPLFVYLPCGVGGGPGGVAFGIKLAFGNDAHCFFAEPTHSPCMLLGIYTGLHDGIAVQDIGIDNCTVADGLAVGRPSSFVGRAMGRLLDGLYTLDDSQMLGYLKQLYASEGIALEPSALAGMAGAQRVCAAQHYLSHSNLTLPDMAGATHLVWATGGGMMPAEEMKGYIENVQKSLT